MRPRIRWAAVVAVAVLVLAIVPTAIVFLSSFSSAHALSFPPTHISLSPYGSLLSNATTRTALVHSVLVGLISVVVAVPVGTLAAFGLRGRHFFGRGVVVVVILLGLASPLVVSGVAFLVIETSVGLVGNLLVLGISIAIVNLPFVVFLVSSALEQMNPELTEASHTLGAEEVQTFLFVTLPEITPAVVASALLLFIFGLTDFTVSVILTTPADSTLPVVVFGGLRSGLTPVLAAAGGLNVVLAVVITWVLSRTGVISRFFFQEG
ncbi:MAG TPA: ABC transporter permease subunit [Acidimicrobiales bacterium]|nr:ABC transporter permease subunit [Acidimicrobiales bacterium]